MGSLSLDGLLPVSERIAFEAAMEGHARRCVRLHPQWNIALPFATSEVPWNHSGRMLVDPSLRPSQFIEYGAGAYYIQDAGSLLALAVLDVQPGERICDLCAAPGGKSSGIVELLGAGGFLLANEAIQSRLALLRYSLSRTGLLNYIVENRDPSRLILDFNEAFDAVLVDAPCSGQTLVSSGKRSTNAFDPNQIRHCQLRQQRIVEAAIRLVRPGGRLVYSTCTFSKEENEHQMLELMSRYPGCWEPIDQPRLRSWRSPIAAGCYRVWPHRDDCEGAFAAGLRLVSTLPKSTIADDLSTGDNLKSKNAARSASRSRGASAQRFASKSAWVKRAWEDFAASNGIGKLEKGIELYRSEEALVGLNIDAARWLDERITDPSTWPRLATFQESTIRPDHALAFLPRPLFTACSELGVDDGFAKKFLRGEAIELGEPMGSSGPVLSSLGWRRVTWQGRGLGWGKAVVGRLNNHLPGLGKLQIG